MNFDSHTVAILLAQSLKVFFVCAHYGKHCLVSLMFDGYLNRICTVKCVLSLVDKHL